MYLVVVSDSHGKTEELKTIRQRHPDASAYLHCGDSEVPESYLDGYAAVLGNNDYFQDFPAVLYLEVEGLKIMVTHGHRFSSYSRLAQLSALAKEHGCTLVCYGHSHTYAVDEIDGITLVNPGSVWRNRDANKPCYAIVTMTDGKLSVERKLV